VRPRGPGNEDASCLEGVALVQLKMTDVHWQLKSPICYKHSNLERDNHAHVLQSSYHELKEVGNGQLAC
jgi:hypothetical protein